MAGINVIANRQIRSTAERDANLIEDKTDRLPFVECSDEVDELTDWRLGSLKEILDFENALKSDKVTRKQFVSYKYILDKHH